MRSPEKHSTRFVALMVVGLLGCTLLAPPLGAQGQDGPERLITELERTDQILERARAIVEEVGNDRAARELRYAFSLQEQAKLIFQRSDASLSDVQHSADLTTRARQLAQRAVNIASQQAHLEQRALRLIEQLDLTLEQAAARISDAPTERSERLLGLATRRLEQARESFQEQRYREAINMVQEALRLLQNLGEPGPGRRLERMFEQTRRLLERVENDASDVEQVHGMIERARTLIEQAEGHLQAGQPFAAERALRQARELLLNVMRSSEAPLDALQVDALLDETAEYVRDIAQQIRDVEHPEAATLVENALRHLDRARELRAAGNLRQALAEGRVARNLARRAAQSAGLQHL